MIEPNKAISVYGDEDKRKKEIDENRRLYLWYRDYLKGIPTLFNKKLGDSPTEQMEEMKNVSFDAGPPPASYHEAMLSHEHLDLLDELNDKHEGEALEKAIDEHPDLQAEEDEGPDDAELAGGDASFGLISKYNRQTGVPKAEAPELLSYLIPRARFNASNAKVSKKMQGDFDPPTSPADYQQLYDAYLKDANSFPQRVGKKVLAFNGFAELYASNEYFAWQRIAGTNPRVIERLAGDRLSAVLAKMKLTDAHVQAVAGADATVAGEAEAGRLYVCDYALLTIVEVQQGRFLAPAIGVFWSDPKGIIKPVAIQLQQTPGRIFTPADDEWPSARAYFASADFNYHEMGTHLSLAHFAQEAFVVAARRNLSKNHPIGALFGQVYYGLLFNNALGRILLVNKGGYTDKMMAGELEKGSLELVRQFYIQNWTWDDWNLPNFLERRGTMDKDALPVYPYRDDGIPLWNAIHEFATAYVAAYYERDAVVANDRALSGFMAELNAEGMGELGKKGFPSELNTREELAELVARLVWQASGGHGGINYSQYQYFAPVANAPGATYADPSSDPLPPLNEVLPPKEQAILQDEILNVLTQKVFGSLGEYSNKFLRHSNDAAKQAIESFGKALTACSVAVGERNKQGPRANYKYAWLSPAKLPNSTNI